MSKNSPTFTRQIFLWQAQVNADSVLTGSALRAALGLSSLFSEADGGAAWPALKLLAKLAAKSESRMLEGLRLLETRGHLKAEWGKQGAGYSGRYWMVMKTSADGSIKLPLTEVSEEEKTSISTGKNFHFDPQKTSAGGSDSSKDSPKEPPKQQPRAREEESGEKEGQAGKYSLDVIEHACRRAAGLGIEDYRTNIEAIAALLNAGYSLEADVLPVIVARKGKSFTSWLYFTDAIKDRTKRRAGNGSDHARGGNRAEPAAKPATTEADREEGWLQEVELWVKYPSHQIDGTVPDDVGCPIPPAFVLGVLVKHPRSNAPHVTRAIRRIEERLDLPEKEKA